MDQEHGCKPAARDLVGDVSFALMQPKGFADLDRTVEREIEIDGAYFGGYVKPANYNENRRDRRLAENQTGKRRVVVVMRERQGQTLPFVFRQEDDSVPTITKLVSRDTVIHADEAPHWDRLHAKFDTRRINHSEAYSHNGACTNMAESFFSPKFSFEMETSAGSDSRFSELAFFATGHRLSPRSDGTHA